MKLESQDSSLIRKLVVPKPTVLVTCVDKRGRANIITIAACTVVSHDPAIFVLAVRPDRHSHDLIAETKEFVINIPAVDLIEETDFCGRKSGRDVDKFADTGLTAVPSSHVNPPLIAECPINIECKVIHSTRQGTHTVFFGEAVNVHVREDLFPEQFLDFKKLPVILSSSTDYLVVGDPIRSRGR